MTNFIRTTSLAATVAFLAATASPALAVTGPTEVTPDKQATATARIVKPLTLKWARDLDLGTIVLSGPAGFTGATVSIDQAGTLDCSNANLTCSGPVKSAMYTITGTDNQVVTVNSSSVDMVNAATGTHLTLTPDVPATVNLGSLGATGKPLRIGGSLSLDSATADGVYVGNFAVTVNY